MRVTVKRETIQPEDLCISEEHEVLIIDDRPGPEDYPNRVWELRTRADVVMLVRYLTGWHLGDALPWVQKHVKYPAPDQD